MPLMPLSEEMVHSWMWDRSAAREGALGGMTSNGNGNGRRQGWLWRRRLHRRDTSRVKLVTLVGGAKEVVGWAC